MSKGTYLLLLQLETPLAQLAIGRLGRYDFAAGYYLYVGSAFGAGGLGARLRRHQQRHKARLHWHIDYLRPHTLLREIWSLAAAMPLEQAWCRALQAVRGVEMPIPGFGASDSQLPSHLLYVPHYPPPRFLSAVLVPAALWQATDMPEMRLDIVRCAVPADAGAV
jgi:Uri superfamily endonuclease